MLNELLQDLCAEIAQGTIETLTAKMCLWGKMAVWSLVVAGIGVLALAVDLARPAAMQSHNGWIMASMIGGGLLTAVVCGFVAGRYAAKKRKWQRQRKRRFPAR